MTDIHGPISRACDSGISLPLRHEAFAELVLHFQDMAFACAYAVLGDAYLAEDVAQDAFVIAWQKLDQLREPNAFPGWFKRIVLSQCNRLTRQSRLQIVPLDVGANSPADDPGPHMVAEKHELLNKVLRAIKALPDKERLVTTLFYVNGYTQADIGEFLEVPVSTVNKRLYTARQRLKESVEVFKDDLQKQRPSRNRTFSDRVNASLRPLVTGDWLPIKTMAYAREQTDVLGNDLWLHRRQHFDEARYVRRQYVAEDANSGQILAFGSIEQTIYLPKYRLFIVTDPRWLKRGVGDLLLERLTNDLREANAITVSCREYASQTDLLAFLKERGFTEVDRVLDLRLEVEAADVSPFLTAVQKVNDRGITITTLAEERGRDPRCVEKLYELTTSLHEDDPGRGPLAPPAYHAREALLWLDMPYVLPDAYFIAKHGDLYVAVSDVSLYEAAPGGITQGFTGVRREYRRQGIATALKLCAIEYARLHRYGIIQTFNRPVQSAVLALNQKLGFQILSSNVTVEKCLREVIEVDPGVYDKYAAHYRDDDHRPDLEMIVRNEGGRLTIEAVGQKVELFPVSETQFFVRYTRTFKSSKHYPRQS
ncbi:MAG: sigma-70 family RNA polymerase sigma factor [Pyrinomonadaceae bacterium]